MEKDGTGLGNGQSDRLVSHGDYFSIQESSSPSRLTTHSRRIHPEPVRPRLASIQDPASPASPRTPRTPRTPLPGRSVSANWNSPGQAFRADDDFFVFEFSSRYLRAGLGGESQPRCQLNFGPETQSRVGDYSRWLSPKVERSTRKHENLENWDSDHVLWRMDVRDLDLGLVADRMERALRTAIAEHLLVMDDSKKRKFILAIPPIMPHPLLSVLLTSLFNVFPPPPSIVLLSSPVLCTIGTGIRSSLVIDIGWADTLVTGVYEYREVQHKRSCRSMKLLSWHLRNMLNAALNTLEDEEKAELVSFEETEEVLNRVVWCRKREAAETNNATSRGDSNLQIPLRNRRSPKILSIPFSQLSRPVETALFAADDPSTNLDDEEHPLPLLIYSTLLSLPIDIRQACLSRIVITGGGSNIPGLKSRLVDELCHMVSSRGWDPVHNYGTAKKQGSRRTTLRSPGVTPVIEQSVGESQIGEYPNKDVDAKSSTPAHLQPPLPDPILASIRSRSTSTRREGDISRSTATGSDLLDSEISLPIGVKIRSLKSVGSWAGASLVAGLRASGVAEVDREKFMQHGLSSGIRMADVKRQSVQQAQGPRQSIVGLPGAGALGKGGERDSVTWSLGAWA